MLGPDVMHPGEDISSSGHCSGMFLVWDFSLSQVKEVWGSAFLRFHSYPLGQLGPARFSPLGVPWGTFLVFVTGSSLVLRGRGLMLRWPCCCMQASPTPVWGELRPPKRDVRVLPLGTCGCDRIWKTVSAAVIQVR